MTDDHGLPPVCWFCGDRHRVSETAGYLANCRVPSMQKRLEALLAEKERLAAALREIATRIERLARSMGL